MLSCSGFERLPLQVLEEILDKLELSSAWRLGGTCKYLHRLILEDDGYWKRRARKSISIQLVDQFSEDKYVMANLGQSLLKERTRDRALVHDPVLNGHKELLKIYILKPTFRAFEEHRRQRLDLQANRSGGGGLFGLLQSLSVFEEFVSRDTFDTSRASHTKLAIFGPGIESSRTKHLVHRIVQAHDSSLNVVDCVRGVPGGIGSGVRVKFEGGRVFDLVCLYTNSSRLRADANGVERLRARNNHMLVQDADDVDVSLAGGPMSASSAPNQSWPPITPPIPQWLHQNVLRVLPTLDVLLFAIDVTSLEAVDMKYVKRELDIMLQACPSRDIPVVVLCCFDTSATDPRLAVEGSSSSRSQGSQKRPNFDMVELANALNMGSLNPRPWSIFEVDAKDMKGFVNALRWIFYRQEKQRNQLKYHCSVANCNSTDELQERLRSLW